MITSNNQRSKSSDKVPANPVPSFPSKENSNEIKWHVPPIKDEVIDLCIDGTAIKSDYLEKEKNISLNKKHWRKVTLKEKSTVSQLKKSVKVLFPSKY